MSATLTDDPGRVLEEAASFLASDPIRHNLVLTLLEARVAVAEAGRYWMLQDDGRVRGVVFHSPLDFLATMTPLPTSLVPLLVDAIVDDGGPLPGVNGEAATVARFAGHWAERTKSPVHPVEGQRLYESVVPGRHAVAAGMARTAGPNDRDLLVAWVSAFQEETGDSPVSAPQLVDRRVRTGQLWIWEDRGQAVALAGLSAPTHRVVRVGPVYTPPQHRRRGYASALVGRLTEDTRRRGHRCILYTQLANPTSNSIYRAIGYRAVAEILRYRFGATAPQAAS